MKALALAMMLTAMISTEAIAEESGCRPHYLTQEELQKRKDEQDAWCEKAKRENSKATPYDLTQCEPDAPIVLYREGC
jgi:hypothetical protein